MQPVEREASTEGVNACGGGQVKKDTLGFMGCEMIRRVVGIAHVEDLESIADATVRAQVGSRSP
jgi:5-methylthioribose kinase